jgi:cell wall-associated NlpC family hydrolase
MRSSLVLPALALLAGCSSAPPPRTLPIPAHGVIGAEAAQLQPGFWTGLAARREQVMLTAEAIAAQNRTLLDQDRSVTDLERLPAVLTGEQVRAWVTGLSRAPGRTLFDERGDSLGADRIAELLASVQPEAIPAQQQLRFALITRRADLRTFPTRLRVFSSRGDTDIDRFQETALFPGTPAVIVHESRDGQWWFVVSPTYTAWIEKRFVAEGTREQVLGYVRQTPFVVVTGPTVRTVYTPEAPAVSEVQLDMGTRVPLVADWPPGRHVNGQHPYTSRVIALPMRTPEGGLALAPALLPRTADVSEGYLPLTPRLLLEQSFKFLGERYGWGHSYNGRDCSGFVSDVYRTFGMMLPRNTGDQAATPVLRRTAFTQADTREQRLAVVRGLQPGDLIFIPGHEMMVIGQLGDEPYIIHDTHGPSYLAPNGEIVSLALNGVVVTPLTPLAGNPQVTWVDRITAIQRIRP